LIRRERPVAARARRIALMQASVPELTRRTCSTLGTWRMISSASSTSRSVGAPKLKPSRAARSTASSTAGWPWPRIIGPHEPM
jgi:hypothetical protein